MQEAEVSLRIANYYIKNALTKENVQISLAKKWSKLEQIMRVGIKFILVKNDGNIIVV